MTPNSYQRIVPVLLLIGVFVPIVYVAAQEQQAMVVTADQERFVAAVTAISDDWTITFQQGETTRVVTPTELVWWGYYRDRQAKSQIVLADQSVVVAEVSRIGMDQLLIESLLWGESKVPRKQVCRWVVVPSANTLERDRQTTCHDVRGEGDSLRLANGDVLTGRILADDDASEETGFGIARVLLAEPGKSRSARIDLDAVITVDFARHTHPARKPLCFLGFRDGSLLVAAKLRALDAGRVEIESVAGVRFQLEREQFYNQLTFLQPLAKGVTYLSDLKPVDYKPFPFLNREWLLGVDRNVLGGRLRTASNIWIKGLGMHSTSRVAFNLGGRFEYFDTELALDDRAGRMGSVIGKVLVETQRDGEFNWHVAYTSPTIRGGDAPLPVRVNVRQARRLLLIIEFADRGDVLDHANWLNPRLIE